MRLAKLLSSLALVAVASAAIAAVPAGGDGVVIEHRDISPRGQEDQQPPFDAHGNRYKAQGFPSREIRRHNTEVLNRIGSRSEVLLSEFDDMYADYASSWQFENDAGHGVTVSYKDHSQIHMMARAATAKAQDLLLDTMKCVREAISRGEDPYASNMVVAECMQETIPWEPAVRNGVGVGKRQETVTAPSAGTTTVYTTVPTATVTEPGVPERPDELIGTHIGGTYGVLTTNVVETQHVTTTTTPGVPNASVVTLTDPINLTATSVRTLGVPTTTVNNTSIDTQSYIDISTFSANFIPTATTTSSLSVDLSIMSQMSSEMSSAMSSVLSSTTVILNSGNTAIAGVKTGGLPTGTSTVASGSAKNADNSDMVAYLATLASVGVCFIFAWFL